MKSQLILHRKTCGSSTRSQLLRIAQPQTHRLSSVTQISISHKSAHSIPLKHSCSTKPASQRALQHQKSRLTQRHTVRETSALRSMWQEISSRSCGHGFIPRQKMNELGEQMKEIETRSVKLIKAEPSMPMIIRADGSRFSAFTKPFDKPVDQKIRKSMIRTSADLMTRFGAPAAYTASDEISLIFPPSPEAHDTAQPHPFGGRLMKIATTVSAYASVRFNFHLQNELQYLKNKPDFIPFSNQEEQEKKINGGIATFDARPIICENEEDLLTNLLWRLADTKRNSVTLLARSYLSHKEIDGVSTERMIELLANKKNVFWEKQSPFHRTGSLIKKRAVWKPVQVPESFMGSQFLKQEKVLRSHFVEIPGSFLDPAMTFEFNPLGLDLLKTSKITKQSHPEVFQNSSFVFNEDFEQFQNFLELE